MQGGGRPFSALPHAPMPLHGTKTEPRVNTEPYISIPFETARNQQTVTSSPMDYSHQAYADFPPSGHSQFSPMVPDCSMPAPHYATYPYAEELINTSVPRDTSQHAAASMVRTYPGTSASGYHNSDMNTSPTPPWMAGSAQNQAVFATRSGQKIVPPNTPAHGSYRNHAPSVGASSRGTYPFDQTFSDSGMPSTPRTDPDHLNSPGPGFGGSQSDMANQLDSMNFTGQVYNEQNPSPGRELAIHAQPRSSTSRKKEYWCEIKDCPHRRPFGTRNDLDRHKLSVHKIASEGQKIYVCQGKSCREAAKNRGWPRKDNFKNHCKVAHSDEDIDDLLKRSESTSPAALSSAELSIDDAGDDNDGRKPSPLHVAIPTAGDGRSPPIYVTPTKEEYSPPHGLLSPQDPRNLSPNATFVRPVKQLPHDPHGSPPGDVILFGQTQPAATPSSDVERELEIISSTASPHVRQYLNDLIRKRSTYEGPQAGEDDGSLTHYCSTCSKAFPRACDLRKHTERHMKRWGCTSTDCNKRFGSKNDWKRHENLVHFQKEIWVCGEKPLPDAPPKSGEQRCVFVCTTPQEFVAHLAKRHGISKAQNPKYVEDQENSRRVGRNCATFMWCGFCEKVIKLLSLDAKQWEERFDHIDTHFKNGCSINNWFPPESSVPKGQMTLPSSLPDLLMPDDFDTTSLSEASCSGYRQDDDVGIPIDPLILAAVQTETSGQRSPKRRAVMSNSTQQWTCCACEQAIMNAFESHCWQCRHRGIDCPGCEHHVVFNDGDSSIATDDVDASINPLLEDRQPLQTTSYLNTKRYLHARH